MPFAHRVQSLQGCVLVVNVLFGATHLMNVVHRQYSLLYVLCQVLHSAAIGAFFSTRLLATGSLWEPILLHAANNICALLVAPSALQNAPTAVLAISGANDQTVLTSYIFFDMFVLLIFLYFGFPKCIQNQFLFSIFLENADVVRINRNH